MARYEFPLSFAQQRLWFLDQLEGPSAVYTVRLPVRWNGPLDFDVLQRAVDAVVVRHESLRTTFENRGGEPVQVIVSHVEVPVRRHECAGVTQEDVYAAVGELSRVPFVLATGPLFRVHLLRLGPDRHLLLLLCHHIVSDAWSSGVLFSDLARAYDALAAGEDLPFEALPVQYADYAVWQRNWLDGPELDRQLAFWRAALADAPADTPLPTDRPRPPRQTYVGQRLTRVLPADLTAAVNAFARAQSCTLFMVLLAAFNVLLARYTGRDDICVGTPIAGRRRTELEGLVGLFVNTLVLRTDLSDNPTFPELLARVRRSALAAFAHQELPFEKLVEELQPVRDQARSPLFQTMFILQNAPWGAQPIRGIEVQPGDAGEVRTAKFDLTVSVNEYEGELWAAFEYNTDLFAESTIECFAGCFETLLRDIVDDAPTAVGRSIHALALLTPQQRAAAGVVAGPVVAPGDPARTVHALFAAQARRTPDAIALEFDGRTCSYAALTARATSLARILTMALAKAMAAAPASASPVVAINTARGPAMLTCVLGVWQSGAAWLPLDPAWPAARIADMLADSGAGIVVTQAALLDELPPFAGVVVLLTDDGDIDEIRGAVTAAGAPLPVAAASPAYLIYTSGSTGRPKGVRVPHGAVVNFLQSMAREPGCGPGDRLLAVTTLSFDIAVLELLLPLITGATVCIAPTATTTDGAALTALLEASAPTIMQATPATWRMLLDAGWPGAADLRILCGGEALDPPLARRLLAAGGELWNLYGPTETTIWSTCARITTPAAPIPIGRPIANTTVHVLDAGMQPVPPGVAGELFIGGLGVADGYHDRAELTAERFVPDPFAADASARCSSERGPSAASPSGGRLYRTGDRARCRADGTLELLGRMDRQVKLRGFRIELGEVEAALAALPGVGSAAVAVVDERLVAWVVPANAPPDVDAWRRGLRDVLPGYMVPSWFVAMDALPLTPNGKLDRRRLPAPDRGAAIATESVAPSGPVEAALARLFADALGLERVGVTDNFFEIGGHSLLATKLIARIRDTLAIEIPLRALFDGPTVAELAALFATDESAQRVVEFAQRSGGLVPRSARLATRAPASFMQQRLWFLDRLEPGSGVYNLAWCLRLTGALDEAALARAVDALVARHESLRTTFADDDGEPVQCIAAAVSIAIECMEVAADALTAQLNTLAKLPFALDAGPLLRVHVLETAPDTHVLLLVIHHIVADGWSMSVLFDELSRAYNAFRRGETPAFAPLPVQYADYAAWQRERLSGAALEREVAHWRERLADAPPLLALPTDRPRPVVQSHRGARLSVTVPAELTARIGQLAGAADCTLFMALLAAFDIVLGRWAGTHDVVVGTPIAGRGRTELEGLIGFFVNTLVLRTRLDGNPTFVELLARVRDTALDAYAHPDLPFERLVDELRPARDTGQTPVFQVMFNLHNEPVQAAVFDGLEATPIGIDRGFAKFDLTVSITESVRGLFVHLEYNADLFARDTIKALAASVEQVLAAVTADPEVRVNALPPTPATARPVAAARDGACNGEWDGDVVTRFAAQARRAPKAIAVRAGERSLSYGALEAQAHAVAARVMALGLSADEAAPRVGLYCATDNPALVAGLLGIWRAGCAWVPLDPSWPAARVAAVAADAGLGALVTDVAHAEAAGALGLPVVELDGATADAVAPVTLEPDALACIIYTSGSTGRPRGVMQTHAGLAIQVGRYHRALQLTAADRLSALSSYAFDAAIQDLFGALCTGATVHLYAVHGAQGALADRTALVEALVADGITVVHATASLYRYLFGGDLHCGHDLSAVRWVVLGGEPVRRSDFELYRSRFAPGTRFCNGLGLTESTLALQFIGAHDTRLVGQSVPVGEAVAGLTTELLDADGTPGWLGEIVVTGAGLSPGYWRDAPRTAARFIDRPAGRALRTGDLGRRLPDGQIVHVGRIDGQLNVRGYRVEPGEIEAALTDLSGITDAVVGTVERGGEPWLVAWVEGTGLEVGALRAALADRLPGYMMPQAIEAVAALPRRANGKVARELLPTPRFGTAAARAGLATGDLVRGELEQSLASIWAEVLGIEPPGLHDDFFALGGHSLLATRVVARVRDRLGVELPLIHLFEQPTIAGLAAVMADLHTDETEHTPPDELISVTR